MATLNLTDSFIAIATVLSQFAATFLFIEHGNWGRNFSEARQREIVAGITVAYLFILCFVLRWRSKREVGYDIGFVGELVAGYSTIGLYLAVSLGFEENTLEKLWVCASMYISVFGLFFLSRAAHVSDTVIRLLLFSAIFKTEGHPFWRIGFGILMAVVILGVSHRDRWLMRARMEAEELKSAEELKKPLLENY